MNELPVIRYCVKRKGFWDRWDWCEGSVKLFFVKNFEFGKRIALFHHYFIRNGVEQNWHMESVSFSWNVIKSINKLWRLHKVDCEIYTRVMVSK